ncbi:MAG: WD40/YVTN/BNR-like repeat-containing protein [Streptomycetales bacterium]
MGALSATPDGTLFAGTGEANPGGGSIVYPGSGVYRSTDDARTWQPVGLADSGSIGRIAVDPTDSDRLFVAASGPLFAPGGQRGLYRSTDGGESFDLVLPGPNPTTGAVDVVVDPVRPNRVYAALWDRIREPDLRDYGGPGSGIYRSTDGGDTWTRLTEGLPQPEEGLGRIGLAVAPSDPDRLYAIVIRGNGRFEGLFTSGDAGTVWTRLPDTETLVGSQSTFGWWFGRVWVDPDDARHVFVAGVPMIESTNGGRTWGAEFDAFHVDQHAMTWSPHDQQRVYIGNDGGVYRSEDDGALGAPWISATREPWTQFYTVAVSRQDPSRISGGSQDNGSLRSWGEPDWNTYVGGDGLENLINPADQENVYGCFQFGNCFRSEDGGDTLTNITPGTVSDRRNWQTPLVFDPTDPSTLYYGGDRVNRSTDQGRTWQVISPDLTGGPGRDERPFGTLTTISVAATDPQRIYAGTDDARLWTSADGGGTWTRLDEGTALPDRWVTSTAVDPRDADRAYATFSGFRAGSSAAHVFRTTDSGGTWTDISGNLPDAPVNHVQLNPGKGNQLYVATDVGVFGTRDGGGKWFRIGEGLPQVPVTELMLHPEGDALFAATYGRGIYRVPR